MTLHPQSWWLIWIFQSANFHRIMNNFGTDKSTAVPLWRDLTTKVKSDSVYFIQPSSRVGLRDFCGKFSSREAALVSQYKSESLTLTTRIILAYDELSWQRGCQCLLLLVAIHVMKVPKLRSSIRISYRTIETTKKRRIWIIRTFFGRRPRYSVPAIKYSITKVSQFYNRSRRNVCSGSLKTFYFFTPHETCRECDLEVNERL